MNRIYYRDASAAILVFDVTNRDSLYTDAEHWLRDVKKNAPEHTIIGMIGNKIDLVNE